MPIVFDGIWADVDSDLARICAEAGDVFTFESTDYPCVVTRAVRSNEAMEGGEWMEYSGKLTTRRALFVGDIPVEGETIIISGQSYVIAKVAYDDTRPPLEIIYQNNPAPK